MMTFLNFDAKISCKVMMTFLIFAEMISIIITLQVLRLRLNSLNQTYLSLKSIMQLTRTTFHDSVAFMKKRVERG
jgi:hypothetical protein